MQNEAMKSSGLAARATLVWDALCDYFRHLGRRRDAPINTRADLQRFVDTRASYVAQTSLYGYLRTRAGMIYPQLFDNDEFVQGMNAAKWYLWLACVSDLCVYAGGLMAQQPSSDPTRVGAVMRELANAILDHAGTPADAGTDFAEHAQRVRLRLANCDWLNVPDDETAFSSSPRALVQWAPVVENLKELDEEIVRNSVRFRWQEVRRSLRRHLNTDAVLRDGA